jgi:hypothetical protein
MATGEITVRLACALGDLRASRATPTMLAQLAREGAVSLSSMGLPGPRPERECSTSPGDAWCIADYDACVDGMVAGHEDLKRGAGSSYGNAGPVCGRGSTLVPRWPASASARCQCSSPARCMPEGDTHDRPM